MTITYTGNLKLALPTTGTEAGTWGDVVNQQITALLDQSVAGTVSLTAMTNADYTLTSGNGSSANEARYMALLVPSTLTLTAARNIIVPTSSKSYIVRNLSTGGFAVTVKTTAGAGISVPNGKTMILYCNATDVIDSATHFTALTLGSALPVLSGGTGVTTSTGTGSVVLNTSPTLVTPALGTPSSGVVTNLTGTASININGTVGATTPTTGAFTTLSATGAIKSTGANLVNEASAIKLSQESASASYLTAYGSNASTQGSLTIVTKSSDGTASTVPVVVSSTGLAVTGTLSATGGVTLSGGTANGVAYLNGSKVLTTGSALTFDGTNTLGVNTGGSGLVNLGSTNSYGALSGGGTNPASIYLNGATRTGLESQAQYGATSHIWYNETLGQERMRLNSTGLGVGTATPLATGAGRGNITINGSTDAILAFGNAAVLAGYILRNTSGITYFSDGDTFQRFFINSAEQMRLTSTGLGIGTSSPGYKLSVSGASSGVVANIGYNGDLGTGFYVGVTHASNLVQLYATGTSNKSMAFYTGSTEVMRYDTSGNLGIGTTSPSNKLEVSEAGTGGGLGGITAATATAGGNAGYLFRTGGSNRWSLSVVGSAGVEALRFYDVNNSSTRMTLDSSGNLGLGVTPSADWASSSYKAFVVMTSFLAGSTAPGVMVLGNNAYNDGAGWKYVATGVASYYVQNAGAHSWSYAASGTAGNPISFTQAMTLDASGNLLVGNTNGSAPIAVKTRSSDQVALRILQSSTGIGGIQFTDDPVSAQTGSIQARSTDVSLQAAGYLQFQTGGSTERARIDSSGNLFLGATSQVANEKFLMYGNYSAFSDGTYTGYIGSSAGVITSGAAADFGVRSNANLVFASGGATERARIDSSGNLLVGTTSATVGAAVGMRLVDTGSRMELGSAQTTNAFVGYSMWSTGAAAYRFYVGWGGTIFATSIVITAISDQRLKENIRDIDTGLSSIMALKPRRFDWKAGKGQDKKNAAGFIAQEFEEVFPECVSTSKAGEDGIEYKNINHETLIPTLVKAIQELKAEFDAYKASHP